MSNVRFRFKLVLVGEGAVGKTSIRQKYMGKGFTAEYLTTIGADFASKVVKMNANGEIIKSIFQIWDLAGQIEFKEVRASFYGGCQGVLLVFDLTRKETMDKLKDWILEAAKNAGGSIRGFYLIGNKSDLPTREVTYEEGLEFAEYLSEKLRYAMPYIETSAKTGENIDYLFQDFCRMFLIKEGFNIPKIPKAEEVQVQSTQEILTLIAEEIKEPINSKAPSNLEKSTISKAPSNLEKSTISKAPSNLEKSTILKAPSNLEKSTIPKAPSNLEKSTIPKAPSAPGDTIILEAPFASSPIPNMDVELSEHVANLEKRVTQIEEYLTKIAKLLKDLIK
ncbi:MAG: GTP-binding protein [Promethearchaeota archaeon]